MIQKKLDKVSGYLYKIEFDYIDQKYFIIAALPNHWVMKTQPDVISNRMSHDINEFTQFFKLTSIDVDKIIDNLLKVIKHNSKVDQLEAKLKEKIANKKQKINQEEMNLSEMVLSMKNNIASQLENDLNKIDMDVSASVTYGKQEPEFREQVESVEFDRKEFRAEKENN